MRQRRWRLLQADVSYIPRSGSRVNQSPRQADSRFYHLVWQANATLALKAALWLRRGLLVISFIPQLMVIL